MSFPPVALPRPLRLLAVLLALAGPAVAAPPPSGAVTGHVVDDAGWPVPGALLTLDAPVLVDGALQTRSDGDGAFRFVALAPGVYTLAAEKAGFGKATRTAIPVQLGRTYDVTLGLPPAGEATVEDPRRTIDTPPADYLPRIPTGRSYGDAVRDATLAPCDRSGPRPAPTTPATRAGPPPTDSHADPACPARWDPAIAIPQGVALTAGVVWLDHGATSWQGLSPAAVDVRLDGVRLDRTGRLGPRP